MSCWLQMDIPVTSEKIYKIREEALFNFPGFHGCISRCGIKIVFDDGKPLVVICSQVKTSPGTSIQNAHEILKNRVFNRLTERFKARVKEHRAQILDEIRQTIESTKKLNIAFFVCLLKFAANKQRGQPTQFELPSEHLPEVYWIEHWPKGTGIIPEAMHLLVTEDSNGDPTWQRVSINRIADELGYERRDFEVDECLLE